jgi:hypothetical protein
MAARIISAGSAINCELALQGQRITVFHFHVSLHAAPPHLPLETIELHGIRLNSLRVTPTQLAQQSFSSTFEEAVQRLARLDRAFVEPDGSFVWVSAAAQPRWQVDGNLYDRAGRLQFVDLKGTCAPERFDELLAALGWPQQQLAFLLTREAIVLDEQSFRTWATSEDSGITSLDARAR